MDILKSEVEPVIRQVKNSKAPEPDAFPTTTKNF